MTGLPQDPQQRTPSMSEVISQVIEANLSNINIALPGEVQSYDDETNLATVAPLMKKKFKDADEAIEIPPITNVPVIQPRTQGAMIRLPELKAGDQGQLIFNQRSIDRWLEFGVASDPFDTRKFHLSDATFVPGLFPLTKPLARKGAKSSLEIQNSKAFIEVLPNGKFKISNGAEEMLSLVNDLMDFLNNDLLILTLIGLQGLSASSKVKLKIIQDKFKKLAVL